MSKKHAIRIEEKGKTLYISDYTIRRFDGKALPDYVNNVDEAMRFDTLQEVVDLISILHNPFDRKFFPEKVVGEQIKKAVATGTEKHHLI